MLLPSDQKKLSTTFYSQTDSQTERQNRIMEAYLRVFVNWEQNNWAKPLPMTEFTYNNAKNASTNHTLFKLNFCYCLRVLFKENVDLCLKSYFTDKLVEELRELMEVCCQNLFYT